MQASGSVICASGTAFFPPPKYQSLRGMRTCGHPIPDGGTLEYPDSASSGLPAGSQLLMRLLAADHVSPLLKVRGRPGSLIRSPGAEESE